MKMMMIVECSGCGKQHKEVEVEMMAVCSYPGAEDSSPIVVECECGWNTCLQINVAKECTVPTRKQFDTEEAYLEHYNSEQVPQWYRDRYK